MQQKQIDINKIRKLPIFFIVGSPRSGTTLLRTIFNAHPNVQIPLEYPFMLFFYKKYAKITNWTIEKLNDFCDDLFHEQKNQYWPIKVWMINEAEFRENIRKFVGTNTFSTISKYTILNFHSFLNKENIQLIGDKNPIYSINLKQLFSLFPEAKFIHITRDYRDHILSMFPVDFGNRLTPAIANRWKKYQKKISYYCHRYPDQFYHIKYEDLVSEPEIKTKEICLFLNIPYDKSIIEFYKYREEAEKFYGSKNIESIHKSLLNPISPAKVDKWKTKMHPNDVKIADFIVGKYAEKYGYSRVSKKIFLKGFLIFIPIFIHINIQNCIKLLLKLFPTRLANTIKYRNSIFEKTYEKVYLKLMGIKSQEKSNNKL